MKEYQSIFIFYLLIIYCKGFSLLPEQVKVNDRGNSESTEKVKKEKINLDDEKKNKGKSEIK